MRKEVFDEVHVTQVRRVEAASQHSKRLLHKATDMEQPRRLQRVPTYAVLFHPTVYHNPFTIKDRSYCRLPKTRLKVTSNAMKLKQTLGKSQSLEKQKVPLLPRLGIGFDESTLRLIHARPTTSTATKTSQMVQVSISRRASPELQEDCVRLDRSHLFGRLRGVSRG